GRVICFAGSAAARTVARTSAHLMTAARLAASLRCFGVCARTRAAAIRRPHAESRSGRFLRLPLARTRTPASFLFFEALAEPCHRVGILGHQQAQPKHREQWPERLRAKIFDSCRR